VRELAYTSKGEGKGKPGKEKEMEKKKKKEKKGKGRKRGGKLVKKKRARGLRYSGSI